MVRSNTPLDTRENDHVRAQADGKVNLLNRLIERGTLTDPHFGTYVNFSRSKA